VQSTRSLLTCGVLRGRVLGPALRLLARRRAHEVQLYADDTQLYLDADHTTVNSKVQHLVACVGEIGQWMYVNRFRLNNPRFTINDVQVICRMEI